MYCVLQYVMLRYVTLRYVTCTLRYANLTELHFHFHSLLTIPNFFFISFRSLPFPPKSLLLPTSLTQFLSQPYRSTQRVTAVYGRCPNAADIITSTPQPGPSAISDIRPSESHARR